MDSSYNKRMAQEALASLLAKLPSFEDKEQFFEAMSIVGDEVSRRIIAKAASPKSPVAVDEFPEYSQTTMIRHLHLLTHAGILSPVWEESVQKFAITDSGRDVGKLLDGESV